MTEQIKTAKKDLRVIFMGTPAFAVPALEALLQGGFNVVAVYSQPPRPAGRGHSIIPSPVHQLAEKHNIPVCTPTSLRKEEAQAEFKAFQPDVAVVAAYGLILPQAVLDIPRWGCLNIHGSILPRWRGAAPIQRALLAGDTETGISIMQMEAGLDSGPYYKISKTAITSTSTAASLHDKLALLGARDIVEVLNQLSVGQELQPVLQDESLVTIAPKLTHEEGNLDWTLSAEELDRYIRALNPWPGTYTIWQGLRLKILEARPYEITDSTSLNLDDQEASLPGTILDDTLTIKCGRGALQILTLQKPGGKPLPTKEFLNGNPLPVGSTFDRALS